MAKPLLDDGFWALMEPLPPRRKRRRRWPGRKRIDDRRCLTGILFVLRTGIPWEHLPQEMGCGSGMTCRRRLREWQDAGVWERVHRLLLRRLRQADAIDWSRAAADSSTIRAVGAGEKSGPNPTDRARPGSKHHVLSGGQGIPLAAILSAANCNDVTQLLPLVEAVPGVAGVVGRPRRRPNRLYADRGYDSQRRREALRRRGIEPHLARRFTEHGSGLGV